jgi:D-alanine-D-alanine ligase
MNEGRLRIAVLLGGRSAEREVSLNTGDQVAVALESLGHAVTRVDTGDIGFIETIRTGGFDVAFICLHGRFGEDGTVQGLLELLELPYVGSGVLASALAMDKVVSKQVFVSAGIKTPAWETVRAGEDAPLEDISLRLGDKVVVKPVAEGSSVGMSIVHDRSELGPAVEQALRHDHTVLIEQFVAGAEVTVGVLGNDDLEPLPTLEVVPEHEFYDYESKYIPGMSRHIIPARVSEEAQRECQRVAVEAHRALQCRGMSRSDTIVTAEGEVYLLEVNTIPGMTRTSLLPDAARAAGIEFPQLCHRLVTLALDRTRPRFPP